MNEERTTQKCVITGCANPATHLLEWTCEAWAGAAEQDQRDFVCLDCGRHFEGIKGGYAPMHLNPLDDVPEVAS